MVSSNYKNVRVVTGKVRFHYVNVFEPRESFEGSTPRYGVCLLIPKEDSETLDKINSAIKEAIKMDGQLGLDRSDESFRLPIRDGDIERTDKPEFSGCYFINATSKYMSEVVDENCFMITDPKEFYSGCYGRTAIKFFPYNMDGNYRDRLLSEGISLTGLNNPNSGAQLKKWLREAGGMDLESLSKDIVEDMIEKAPNEKVKRVLQIRRELLVSMQAKSPEMYMLYKYHTYHFSGDFPCTSP